MANLNIICKSDKCEFVNYFSEPLVFPKNAEISLVKANLTVPVLAQQKLTIPRIPIGDRGLVWLDVIIDGIEETFTWRNLYDTFNIVPNNLEQVYGVTENEFFSGNFIIFTNNPYKEFNSSLNVTEYKISFQEVIGYMLNERFAFYVVRPYVKYERNETEIFAETTWQDGSNIDVLAVTPVRQLNWGFTSIYNPRGMNGRNPTNMTLDVANNVNWTIATNNLTSITGGGAGVFHNLHYADNNTIDPNGGFYHFNKNAGGTGLCAVGVKVSFSPIGGTRVPATLIDTTIIDVGLEFGRDAANTVRAMDGYKELTPGVYSQSFAPTHPIDTFDATDEFFIMVSRDSITGPNSNKFRVIILQGIAGSDIDDCTIIYESSVIGPTNPQIAVNFIAMAHDVGHEITNLTNIPVHTQSVAQGEFVDSVPDEGIQYQGAIVVQLGQGALTNAVDTPTVDRFFNVLGLNKYLGDSNRYYYMSEIEQEQNTPLQLQWGRKLQLLSKDCDYVVGPSTVSNHYREIDNNLVLINSISNLPRQLDVRLNNITLKNFSGSQPNASNATGSLLEEGLNRIVGTIPTPKPNNVSHNVDWVIQYEPYTPVYRPLNNDQPFTINQLNVEVSYKDFQTNQRKTIDRLDGIMSLEFHVKPMAEESKPGNNIRPY